MLFVAAGAYPGSKQQPQLQSDTAGSAELAVVDAVMDFSQRAVIGVARRFARFPMAMALSAWHSRVVRLRMRRMRKAWQGLQDWAAWQQLQRQQR